MSGVEARLADLHTAVSRFALVVADAGRGLVRLSASPPVPAAPRRDLLALRTARLSWEMSLVQRQEEVFLVWKGRPKEGVLARAKVRLRLDAVDPAVERAGATLQYRISRTRIVVDSIEDPELDVPQFGAPYKIDEKNSILLRVGPNGEERLFVQHLKEGVGPVYADVMYGQRGFWRWVRREDEGWEAAPFLALLAALKSWARSDPSAGPDEALDGWKEKAKRSVLFRFLSSLADAYVQTSDLLATGALPSPEDPPWLRGLVPSYRVAEFEAEGNLQIGQDGHLATVDAPRCGLGFVARLEASEPSPCLRFNLTPPDFLVGGARHVAFVEALREQIDDATARDIGFSSSRAFGGFLDRAEADIVFFRTQQNGKIDTDLAFLVAPFEGRPRNVLLEIDARVSGDDAPKVEVLEIRNDYDDVDDPDAPMSDAAVDYLFHMITALKGWSEARR